MERSECIGRLAVASEWGSSAGGAGAIGDEGTAGAALSGRFAGACAPTRFELGRLDRHREGTSEARLQAFPSVVEMGSDLGRPTHAGHAARERGFTATELLIALAVAGVLVTLAVPGFAALTRSAGLSSAANELLLALHTARSAAVLRGLPVAVCLTADGRTCVSLPDSAASGWLVFVPDGSAAVSRPAVVGEVLARFRLPDRLTVSASRPTVTFWPVTRAAATSTFDLCDVEGAGRSIIVSQTGRPRVAAEVTSCA